MSEAPPTGAEWVEAIVKALHLGYLDALADAREAVDALVPSEFWEGIEGRPAQWWIVKAEALAAIDALRKP